MELDHQRLKKQEQMLRKDMGKQRVKQLKIANEDEDKTIHKLEKLLKIDKSKSKKGIPRMFHDGLDYALEMCLPENIEKMYAAAKEAANADQQSDSEWQEDFAMATGEFEEEQQQGAKKGKKSQQVDTKIAEQRKIVEKKKASNLRKIESKYFGASDDELASDLDDVDSEFERSEQEDEGSDLGEEDSEGEFGEECTESENNESDDEAPEEIATVSKASKKRQLEKTKAKAAAKQAIVSEDDEFDDSDLGEDSDFEASSDDEPKLKVPKVSKNEDDDNSDFDSDAESHGNEEKPEIWEDIYGRKRDKAGNVINEKLTDIENNSGKYVPPHMRARLAAEANADNVNMDPKRREKLLRLKRLLKGQLNRLSEANMHKISSEIDSLYMQNSRNDMNTTLSTLICDALISHALAPERMVMEHSLLIAALHANVGTEVGANLLENLVDRFHQMLDSGIQQYDVEDKTLDNVIFVLCHMYTFKVSQGNLCH